MLESHGASRILASFHDIVPHWIFAGLYFSDTFITAQPDNLRKVLKGLMQSFEFIATHEKEARSFLPKYTNVDEELCMLAALRQYSPIEPMDRIANQMNLMVTYGYIKNQVDLRPMLDYRFIPQELKNKGQDLSGENK